MKKYITLLVFLLLPALAMAQPWFPIPIGNNRPNDTVATKNHMRIDGKLRLASYISSDTNKVLGIDGQGNVVVRTKSTGGGGGTVYDSVVMASFYNVDSFRKNIYPKLALYLPLADGVKYTDTAAMQAGYVRINRLLDSMAAVQLRLNQKENTITATTSADYYRGDKTFQTLNKTAVGLSNVDNTSDANKPVSTATQTALDLKINTSAIGSTVQGYNVNTTILGNGTTGSNNIVRATSPSIVTPLLTSLSSGTTADSLLVADASTGQVRRISSSRIASAPSTLPPLPEISKVVDWFDASDITGVTDGASLSTWTNKISSGTNMTAVTAPTYIANYKGMPGVRFTSASAQSMTFTSHTFKQCIIVGNNLDGSVFVSYAGLLTDAGLSGFAWYADPVTSTTGMGKNAGSITTQGFGTSNNSFFPLGRTKITELTEPAGIAATTLRLGGFYDPIAGRFWNGVIHDVIFFNDPLTPPAFREWYRYLTNKYRLDKAPFVRAAGNSIMIGGYSGVTTSQSVGYWINQYLRTYYDNDIDFVNKAVGGNTISQQDFLARTVGGIDFEMGQRVIMGNMDIPFLGFTNDLHGVGDGAKAFDSTMKFCENRIKVNPSVVIWIIPPYSCDSAQVLESERQIALQLLRDFKQTKNIRVLPSDDTLLYGPLACYTSGLFIADHIHPNATGAIYGAKLFFDYYIKYKD